MDLLSAAAEKWKRLLDIEYEFVFGRKRELFSVYLTFTKEGFYHNAGFQYADDIQIPYITAHKNILKAVLENKISFEMIQKSHNYQKLIEPRLKAIILLPEILDGAFKTYTFDRKRLPFFTKIDAKYLISGNCGDVVFLFSDVDSNDGNYFVRSVFVMDRERDYRKNQTQLTLLRKTRYSVEKHEKTVLFTKAGFDG